MSEITLDRVLEEVKALPPEAQRQLRDLLDEWLGEARPQMSEAEFARHLMEQGLISKLPEAITDLSPWQNRQPVQAQGQPLSETIIEDRR
jgi:hypothetical protein